MFANLKNKLLEEVKASPSKFQQFAQAAQAAVSSSSNNVAETVNASDGNFFSITEEDTPQNSPQKAIKEAQTIGISSQNASSLQSTQNSLPPLNNGSNKMQRTRKLSNSSMASDISFRTVPNYETTTIYHLQSDLDVSGSEHEDSASTTHLDIISKEQLHDAYRRALDRYQKYRTRYTDLAKRYRELERDCTKARAVLVETQDKAIRKISELREQCSLEQQAKAHLEEALRMEMDDMQCKIKSYETKLEHQNQNFPKMGEESLVKLDDQANLIVLETENNQATDTAPSLNYEIILKEKSEQISQLESHLEIAQKQIEDLKKQEEENTIQLAKKKLDIYSELENKEKEINDLKNYRRKYNELELKCQQLQKDNTILNKQMTELSELKEKMQQIASQKQELEAKAISHDHIIKELKKTIKDKDDNIDNLKKASDEKLQSVLAEYEEKIQKFQSQTDSLSSNKPNNKTESDPTNIDSEICKIQTENNLLKTKLQELELEKQHIIIEKEACENRVKELSTKIQTISKENKEIESREINNLRHTLENLTSEKLEYQEKAEKEKTDLNIKIGNILSDINNMQIEIEEVRCSHSQLEKEKLILEKKIENMHKENSEALEGSQRWQSMVNKAENKLKEVEEKLQKVGCENCLLAEKNRSLEENSNRLEKLISESDANSQKQVSFESECKKDKDNIKKLEEDLEQKLRENANLQIERENLERSLRTKTEFCKELISERNSFADSNKIMEIELNSLKEESNKLLSQINEINNSLRKENSIVNETLRDIKKQNKSLTIENEKLDSSNKRIFEELTLIKSLISNEDDNDIASTIRNFKKNYEQIESDLKSLNESYSLLKEQHSENIIKYENTIKDNTHRFEKEIKGFNKKISVISDENEALKQQNRLLQKELDALNKQKPARLAELEKLLKETKDHNQTLQQSVQNATDLEKKLQNYEQLKIENEYLNTLTNQLETDLQKLKSENSKLDEEINQLKSNLRTLNSELSVVNISNDNLNKEIITLTSKIKNEKENSEKNLIENEATQKELLMYEDKLAKLTVIYEENLESYKNIVSENSQLKSKLESLQTSSEKQINELKEEVLQSKNSIQELIINLQESKKIIEQFQNVHVENEKLKDRIKEMEIDVIKKVSNVKLEQQKLLAETSQKEKIEMENLRTTNLTLQSELESLRSSSALEVANLNREIENLSQNSKEMHIKLSEFESLKEQGKQLSIELEKLKSQDLVNQTDNQQLQHNLQDLHLIKQERDELQQKFNKIMHEVQDVSNRNLFLEQQCENVLILEQSNERLKLANEKLSRQLDETLVSIHHNEGIQANTEFEYLKNIMFQYLTGTVNGNNETLVKVIAAVLKFSPQQTQVAIEKEHQRHSLLGQINKLL